MKKINETKVFENKIKKEYETGSDLHAYSIDYLMNDEKEAIRLHLDNLVLTYGFRSVKKALDSTSLDLITKSKKAS